MIEVSVIIPTHNRCELLKKAVESVLAQTMENLEVLVCDDGSTDNTRKVIEDLQKADHRIQYIYCGKNGRPAIPRNRGIKCAKGEWLAFLDDDDYWCPQKLERQLDVMKRKRVLASCTNAYRYQLGKEEKKLFFEKRHSRKYTLSDIYMENPIICSSALIHHSLVDYVYGFAEEEELKAIEDYALWFRVCCFTKFAYMNEPLLFYLESSDSSIRMKAPVPFKTQRERCISNLEKWVMQIQSPKRKHINRKVESVMKLEPIWILRRMVRKRIWK